MSRGNDSSTDLAWVIVLIGVVLFFWVFPRCADGQPPKNFFRTTIEKGHSHNVQYNKAVDELIESARHMSWVSVCEHVHNKKAKKGCFASAIKMMRRFSDDAREHRKMWSALTSTNRWTYVANPPVGPMQVRPYFNCSAWDKQSKDMVCWDPIKYVRWLNPMHYYEAPTKR